MSKINMVKPIVAKLQLAKLTMNKIKWLNQPMNKYFMAKPIMH
jgi:hypothetical protein